MTDADKLRAELVEEFGEDDVFTTDEVRERFTVHSFLAPFCSVTRLEDGERGTLQFTHQPRFYFHFIKRGNI